MLMFAIYLTFLFINFILFEVAPHMPGYDEREMNEIKAKLTI